MPALVPRPLPCCCAICCLKLESVGPGLMRQAIYYTTGKEPDAGEKRGASTLSPYSGGAG